MSVIVWENTIIIWKKQQRELPHVIAAKNKLIFVMLLYANAKLRCIVQGSVRKPICPNTKKMRPKIINSLALETAWFHNKANLWWYSWCKFCHWSWSFSIPTFNEPASDAPPSPWVFIFHVSSVKNMQDKNQSYKSLCNNTQMLLVSNCSRWNRKIHGLGKCKNTCYRFLPSLYEPIKLPPSRP